MNHCGVNSLQIVNSLRILFLVCRGPLRSQERAENCRLGLVPCPVLPFLVFLEFLVFFPCEEFLVFSSVFPFFSRDFRGSVGIKNPCFFGGFPCLFPKKKQGKEGQGEVCPHKRWPQKGTFQTWSGCWDDPGFVPGARPLCRK